MLSILQFLNTQQLINNVTKTGLNKFGKNQSSQNSKDFLNYIVACEKCAQEGVVVADCTI
jgi:hypothetical protein